MARGIIQLVSPSRALESEAGYLYHASNEEALSGIAERGLRTHDPSHGTEQDEWPDGSVEKRSYWSRSASSIWHFAPEYGRAVALRARESAARFRRESTGDYYCTQTVPAAALEILTTEGWLPLLDLEPA